MVGLDKTYGALLVGIVVASVLYGCVFVQAWTYYMHYPSDWWHTKFLVAGVLLSETCHQSLIAHAVYIYLVKDFGMFEKLDDVVWSLIVSVFFNAFTTFLAQCFLAMRVYRLSRKNWFATGSTMMVIIAQFVMLSTYVIKATRFHTFPQLAALKPLSLANTAVIAAGDLFIALLLCSLLYRSRTGFRRSDTMINRLIMFSINTGLLTSLWAIAALVSLSLWPRGFIHVAFYLTIGRMYCNSLLTTLNARKKSMADSRNECISLSEGVQRMPDHSCGTSSRPAANNIFIKVDTIHEYIREERCSLNDDMKNPGAV